MMNRKRVELVIDCQLYLCLKTLNVKASEYTIDDTDRLHNFKKAAALQSCSQRVALGGMLAKHLISVYDMIEADECATMAMWDEKITDSINYLLLLKAMAVEELSPEGN
jgi:hypothetical protein